MKNLTRRAAIVAAAVITSFGAVSLPTAAEADTGWPSRVVVKSGTTR